jgi:hypothetical protein
MTSIETLCPSSDYVFKRHKCELCNFRSQHKWVVRRHIKAKHKDKNQTQTLPPTVSSNVEKENPSQQPLALSNNDDGNNNANTDDTMLVTETETETSQERKRKSNSDNNDVDADIENTNKRQRIENEADPVLLDEVFENQEQIAFNQKYPNNNLDQILSRGKKRKFNPLENVIDQVSTGKKSKSGDIILASGNSGIVEDEHILEGNTGSASFSIRCLLFVFSISASTSLLSLLDFRFLSCDVSVSVSVTNIVSSVLALLLPSSLFDRANGCCEGFSFSTLLDTVGGNV